MGNEIVRVYSHAPWESKIGYCRAIKAGQHIYVTGTAPIDDRGASFAPGDAYAQACRCFELIRMTLKKFDVDLSSVMRTRMFVTDISKWELFGQAHKEFFGSHPPATTMVEVKSLIDPSMLIEVEADAFVS
ncbi:MAG: RidA family protein [Proteobacteria bacterium]|nr:RidA family protein [Pseudomonadota bacterium]